MEIELPPFSARAPFEIQVNPKTPVYHLMSHRRAMPRRIQWSAVNLQGIHKGVMKFKSVRFGFLYTGHWNYREKVETMVKSC